MRKLIISLILVIFFISVRGIDAAYIFFKDEVLTRRWLLKDGTEIRLVESEDFMLGEHRLFIAKYGFVSNGVPVVTVADFFIRTAGDSLYLLCHDSFPGSSIKSIVEVDVPVADVYSIQVRRELFQGDKSIEYFYQVNRGNLFKFIRSHSMRQWSHP